MSHFYGLVSGSSKTDAGRCGNMSSGITASAQSYSGSVIVQMTHRDKADDPWVEIAVHPGSSAHMGSAEVMWEGPISTLLSDAPLFKGLQQLQHLAGVPTEET